MTKGVFVVLIDFNLMKHGKILDYVQDLFMQKEINVNNLLDNIFLHVRINIKKLE